MFDAKELARQMGFKTDGCPETVVLSRSTRKKSSEGDTDGAETPVCKPSSRGLSRYFTILTNMGFAFTLLSLASLYFKLNEAFPILAGIAIASFSLVFAGILISGFFSLLRRIRR